MDRLREKRSEGVGLFMRKAREISLAFRISLPQARTVGVLYSGSAIFPSVLN